MRGLYVLAEHSKFRATMWICEYLVKGVTDHHVYEKMAYGKLVNTFTVQDAWRISHDIHRFTEKTAAKLRD